MLKILLSLFVLFLGGGNSSRDWELVWADEFDYTGLPDKSKWTYEQGFVRNRELQYYTRERKENARVEKGKEKQ